MKKTFIKIFYANKSLKSKIVPVILSLLLVITTISPLLVSKAYAQNFPALSGVTYLNMPEKRFGGKTTQCKLAITNFNLNKNKFSLSGIVLYSNRNYPLNIEGTLYKSRIGKNNFVALAKDTTNTFDVLHFSILFNPDVHFLVTKKMRNTVSELKQRETGTLNSKLLPVITVYLKRKNTREVSFIEGSLIALIKSSESKSLRDSFLKMSAPASIKTSANGPFGTDIYVQKILKPYKITRLSKYVSVTNGAGVTKKLEKIYEENYTSSLGNVTLHMSYVLLLTGPSGTMLIPQRTDNDRIELKSNYTISNADGYNRIIHNNPFSLGKPSNPVEIDDQLLSNSPYDSIQIYEMKQQKANYGSTFLPNVDFSIETPYGSIGFNLVRAQHPGTVIFDLLRQDILGNYSNGNAYNADEKTFGYWLNIPGEYKDNKYEPGSGSFFRVDLTYDVNDNAQSSVGYRYVYFTVPIYIVNYNGFGVTFDYRTTYGDSLYYTYVRR